MKLLIALELTLLFFASTFKSHNPPGWYQVPLPVNGFVKDIKFIDENIGWVAVDRLFINNDTSYVLYTTDSGDSWRVQFKAAPFRINVIDFVDENTGFAGGTSVNGKFIMKSTNGGENWAIIFDELGNEVSDLDFVDPEFGWYCEDEPLFGGGVFRTTDGGNSWQRLTEPGAFSKLFFLNKDTGWVNANGTQRRLYRTTNGGLNWQLQFVSAFEIDAIFFLDSQRGWMRGGPEVGTNGVSYTTNGGFNWTSSNGNVPGGWDVEFVNEHTGYAGASSRKVLKSTDGGRNFGYQVSPLFDTRSGSFLRNDTALGWMGLVGLISTVDGGGKLTDILNSNLELAYEFSLHQNYPNPFNPTTKISFELAKSGNAELSVFDIRGVRVKTLINKMMSAGSHVVDFNASDLSSGVYLYSLNVDGKQMGVRRMTLLK